MTVRAKARKPGGPWRVVFDGQSLNTTPTGNAYPRWAMSGRRIPWQVTAVDGTAWDTLATTVATRTYPQLGHETKTLLCLNGGQQNITNGDSGSTLYSKISSYADNARTAGFTKVITMTLTPCTLWSSGQNSAKDAYNTLVVADAGAHFDAVVDLRSITQLTDASNLTYFDGVIHPTTLGSQILGAALNSTLDSLLV